MAKAIAHELGDRLNGLVHCSGGGQTKCLRFGSGVHHIKDNLFPVPPLFAEIQKASGTTDEEMHQVYNMGHRLEAYCSEEQSRQVIEISQSFGIDAQVIGRTEASERTDRQIMYPYTGRGEFYPMAKECSFLYHKPAK